MSSVVPTPLSQLASHVAARPPTVVCVGLSAWDQVWQVDELPPGGSGKRRANDHREGGGGMAANAAVAVARLGGQARFWGRAGADAAGRAMRDDLVALGVDVSGFRLFAGGRSSVSGVIVDAHGERSIVNFRGGGLPEPADWLPLAETAQADAVLADPRWPAGALAAFRAARGAGVPTVLDGDVADPPVFDALLPWVDAAVFSAPGLAGYAASAGVATGDIPAQLRFARQQGARLAAVTLGEQGVHWLDDAGLQHQRAIAVPVVDTTGAGDVFHGALAYGLGAPLTVPDAMRLAAAVAAAKCRHAGSRQGIPDLAGALALLADTDFKEN